MLKTTPLEAWIREKTGIDEAPLDDGGLEAYRLRKLNETISHARQNSPFYGKRLSGLPDRPLGSIDELRALPFTCPADIISDPVSFAAVGQAEIARIVTLNTSGSTGTAKRLFFTGEDLELTVDFFHHGMSTMVGPGDTVGVFLPGERPDSVGDLLRRGLERLGVMVIVYGPVSDASSAAASLHRDRPDCLVGIPTQILEIAYAARSDGRDLSSLRNVLLSTDYVPASLSATLKRLLGCEVYGHYGMTEMGLGGGVECSALNGYHLREADLYFEVIDRETGEPCAPGETGEVVFTTLTRRGMPLIRYRTGDIATFLPGACPCGSSLRRLDKVGGRWEGLVELSPGNALRLPEIDEALFSLEGLLDYRLVLAPLPEGGYGSVVKVHAIAKGGPTAEKVGEALLRVPAIAEGLESGRLAPPVIEFSPKGRWTTTGVAKRKICFAA